MNLISMTGFKLHHSEHKYSILILGFLLFSTFETSHRQVPCPNLALSFITGDKANIVKGNCLFLS
jgi:hypothetical protein